MFETSRQRGWFLVGLGVVVSVCVLVLRVVGGQLADDRASDAGSELRSRLAAFDSPADAMFAMQDGSDTAMLPDGARLAVDLDGHKVTAWVEVWALASSRCVRVIGEADSADGPLHLSEPTVIKGSCDF